MSDAFLIGDRPRFGIELRFGEGAGSYLLACVTLWIGREALGREGDLVMVDLVLDSLERMLTPRSEQLTAEILSLPKAEAWERLTSPSAEPNEWSDRLGDEFRIPTTEFFDDYSIYCIADSRTVRLVWKSRLEEQATLHDAILERDEVARPVRELRALYELLMQGPSKEPRVAGSKATLGIELHQDVHAAKPTFGCTALWIRGHQVGQGAAPIALGSMISVLEGLAAVSSDAPESMGLAATAVWQKRTLLPGQPRSALPWDWDVRSIADEETVRVLWKAGSASSEAGTEAAKIHDVMVPREAVMTALEELRALDAILARDLPMRFVVPSEGAP